MLTPSFFFYHSCISDIHIWNKYQWSFCERCWLCFRVQTIKTFSNLPDIWSCGSKEASYLYVVTSPRLQFFSTSWWIDIKNKWQAYVQASIAGQDDNCQDWLVNNLSSSVTALKQSKLIVCAECVDRIQRTPRLCQRMLAGHQSIDVRWIYFFSSHPALVHIQWWFSFYFNHDGQHNQLHWWPPPVTGHLIWNTLHHFDLSVFGSCLFRRWLLTLVTSVYDFRQFDKRRPYHDSSFLGPLVINPGERAFYRLGVSIHSWQGLDYAVVEV